MVHLHVEKEVDEPRPGDPDPGRLDHVNLALAFLLFLSPWLLGFTDQPQATKAAWTTALVIAAVSSAANIHFAKWEELINLAAGVWLVLAPWILDFQRYSAAVAAFVAVGCIVASIAMAELLGVTKPEPPAG